MYVEQVCGAEHSDEMKCEQSNGLDEIMMHPFDKTRCGVTVAKGETVGV
jgi:hypothetical protein